MARSGFIALCDTAFEALGQCESLSEDALLARVYGGTPPAALKARLAAPLLEDPRLERRLDGSWARRQRTQSAPTDQAVSVLALATTGPTPGRGRIVHVCALHVAGEAVVGRFSATVQPGRRVPGYVAARLGLDTGVLDELQPIESVFDELIDFLGARPVFAQDALLMWGFVEAEARARGRVLAPTLLVDVNELARRSLDAAAGKPSLARVAQHFGVAFGRIEHPDEEARVLALVVPRLLHAVEPPVGGLAVAGQSTRGVLRRGETARALPDEPGVYVLRGSEHEALYVGKARRLRSRMSAYVHRPLGPTRRLEGLVGTVEAVESAVCETELEALVLEDREIRRLQPRFNTVRRQRAPRTWLRLPPQPPPRRAPRRIELSAAPIIADGSDFVGPFRNELGAEHARRLARDVFELDALRRGDPAAYTCRLFEAWQFLKLGGDANRAYIVLRQRQQHAAAAGDAARVRQCEALLAAVRRYDPANLLLPADPRLARYAVIRPGAQGVEGFVLDRGILVQHRLMTDDDATRFAAELLAPGPPRTSSDDVAVTLRWLGAQRASARLVLIQDEQVARDAIEDAALASAAGKA